MQGAGVLEVLEVPGVHGMQGCRYARGAGVLEVLEVLDEQGCWRCRGARGAGVHDVQGCRLQLTLARESKPSSTLPSLTMTKA